MKFATRTMVLFAILLINGCSLLNYDVIIPKSAYQVAKYNYTILSNAKVNDNPYLLVNDKLCTSERDLFLYINDTQKILTINNGVIKQLLSYNKRILEE